MTLPSHRGYKGSTAAKKSAERASLISLFTESEEKAGRKISIGRRRQSNSSRSNNVEKKRKEKNVDATPQELYAIGAVFDYLYRGGSPLNCVNVFRREVNRPSSRPLICGGFGLYEETNDYWDGEDDTVLRKIMDDETLPTFDDGSYTMSTYEEDDGTYSTFQTNPSLPNRRNSKQHHKTRSDDSGALWSAMGEYKIKTKNSSSLSRRISPRCRSIEEDDSIESDERVKTWGDMLVAAVEETAPEVAAAAQDLATSERAQDIQHLIRMMREGIPESTKASTTALQAAFVRTFQANVGALEREEVDEAAPLNSLAMRMKSMATKEPTRTYAVSERSRLSPKKNSKNAASAEKSNETTTSGATVSTVDSDQDPTKLEEQGSGPTTTTTPAGGSVSGLISTADTDAVGSHRGDSGSVSAVPSSIRLASPVMDENLIPRPSPGRMGATTTPLTRRPSLFRRKRSSVEGKNEASKGHLPPIPPPSSSTVPSSARRAADLDDLSVPTDLAIVSMPPKIKRSSTFNSIGLKKHFSFRRKNSAKSVSTTSPKSTIDFGTELTPKPTNEFYVDGRFIDIDDEASNVAGLLDEKNLSTSFRSVDGNATTDGVLANETNYVPKEEDATIRAASGAVAKDLSFETTLIEV